MRRSHEVRTIPMASLILIYVSGIPTDLQHITMTEVTLLAGLKKHAYSGSAICCRTEIEACHLLNQYISLSEAHDQDSLAVRTDVTYNPFSKCVISYPILKQMEVVHIDSEGNRVLIVARKTTDVNIPSCKLDQSEKYYFIFDLQPLRYKELINKISELSP